MAKLCPNLSLEITSCFFGPQMADTLLGRLFRAYTLQNGQHTGNIILPSTELEQSGPNGTSRSIRNQSSRFLKTV